MPHSGAMSVPVCVHEIGALEKRAVSQYFTRGGIGGEPPRFQYAAAVGNIAEVLQIVRRGDYGFRPSAPTYQLIDQFALTARIERGRGLVE